MDLKKIGFIVGPAIFIIMNLLPAPYGMEPAAWRVAAIALLMATWWITESIPIAATALLPIALYPLLRIMDTRAATASYSDPVIYLFMGGFFLAVTMERWNLHRRIALVILKMAGDTPSRLLVGFVAATGFLSMWISNTATAVMMIPIAISIVSQVVGEKGNAPETGTQKSKYETNFAKSLVLGVAYAASIGGFITLIGTPVNIIMAGVLETTFDIRIGFAQWMLISVPIAAIMFVSMHLLFTKVLFPTGGLKLAGGKDIVEEELQKLGPTSRAEKMIMLIGAFMALSWMFREFIIRIPALSMVTDTTIAIVGALLLFICPSFKDGERLMDWDTAVKIPWNVVLLFGGGLTLASGFERTGLALWVSGNMSHLTGMHILLFIFIMVAVSNILTEFMSNTAIATLFIPVMGVAAIAMGFHPFAAVISTALGATFSFMMPVATPPNAVAFGSGYLKIKDMVVGGIFLNLIAQVTATIIIMYILPILWDVDLTVVPAYLLLNP